MENSQPKTQLFTVLFCGVIATLTIGALPVFIARIGEAYELTVSQLGLLASSDLGGCAFGCVIALLIQKKIRWHLIFSTAIGLTLVGNLVSIFSADFLQLLVSRFSAGLGNGIIVSLVFTVLCSTRNPDRNFGLFTLGQLIAQALTLPLFTYLVEIRGIEAIFLFMALASTTLFLFLPLFPRKRQEIKEFRNDTNPYLKAKLEQKPYLSVGAILSLLGLSIYFCSFSAIWAFFDPIGQSAGLSVSAIGKALGIASLIGILGPVAVVVLQPHLKRSWLLTTGIAIHITSIIILLTTQEYMWFLMGTSIFIFSLNFVFPFQMGTLAAFDTDGTIAVTSLVVQLGCLAIGPILGSIVYSYTNQSFLLISVIFGFLFTILLFLTSMKILHR